MALASAGSLRTQPTRQYGMRKALRGILCVCVCAERIGARCVARTLHCLQSRAAAAGPSQTRAAAPVAHTRGAVLTCERCTALRCTALHCRVCTRPKSPTFCPLFALCSNHSHQPTGVSQCGAAKCSHSSAWAELKRKHCSTDFRRQTGATGAPVGPLWPGGAQGCNRTVQCSGAPLRPC